MRFPIHDWQFWLVTAIAAIAAGWLLRGIIWRRILRRGHGRSKGRRATLTIKGKPVSGPVSRNSNADSI